ncbi:hypothetical protein SAMN02910298_01743 [Pseudobutyrivibrio sp. YE44]|uniref:hypothetical protein n=1 Tax=Pseudobutyrivibrio sp. YE44 TaxID=1520802 RepID=UPI00088923D0|nr:hypothetical protein [Pseudobutyrivibrio sp. YE44]SDB35378.1 hypothetical protein SAMN02910298_01743 [Pseudobutyrivibrio sp. YE44]
MKKNLIASLLAMTMVASMFTGCGKGSEDSASKADTSTTAEESKEKKSDSKLDDSKGRVVGKDSKWDGVFTDSDGRRFWAGMTINEIVEQGCLVSPNYFSDDHEVIKNSITEMSIPPLSDSENFGSGYDCLEVWNVDGDDFSTNDFDEHLWYYNPYPYAVSFGECKVGAIIAGLDDIENSDSWDKDGDEKISAEELEAVFDIAPITNEYETHIYPFEGFAVDFNVDNGHVMRSPIQADAYDAHPSHAKELADYVKPFTHEYESETLDNSLDSYTFKMALDEYTIDLSFFESIEEITRSYLKESDYTKNITIKGNTVDGDYVTVTLEHGDENIYGYDMETYAKKNYLDSEKVGSETLYCNNGAYNSVSKFANGTIKLEVSVEGVPDAAHTLEVTHKVESVITAKGQAPAASEDTSADPAAETEN